jgi:hypothetical protein
MTTGTTFRQVRKTAENLKKAINNVNIMDFPEKGHFVYIDV